MRNTGRNYHMLINGSVPNAFQFIGMLIRKQIEKCRKWNQPWLSPIHIFPTALDSLFHFMQFQDILGQPQMKIIYIYMYIYIYSYIYIFVLFLCFQCRNIQTWFNLFSKNNGYQYSNHRNIDLVMKCLCPELICLF